jgi:hypothetical protein
MLAASELLSALVTMKAHRSVLSIAVACLLIVAAAARAATFDVTITSPGLAGIDGALAFDFIEGDSPPSNEVTLGPIATTEPIASTSVVGDVTGSGPWTFRDTKLLNSLVVVYKPLGASFSFRFTSTDFPPPDPASGIPDSFALYVLADDLVTPLITTDDPTGANALLQYDLGVDLTVFRPDQSDFDIVVSRVVDVPEPPVLLLLVAATLAVVTRRKPAASR